MAVGKSTDGGLTWTHTLIGADNSYIYSMALDPSHPDTVYAAGYENSVYTIYRTLDGGTSWSKLTATGLNALPYGMAIRPDNPLVIVAATSNGIYRSLDAGGSFTRMSTTIGSSKNVLIDPLTPSTMYLGTNSQGVYRSTDGGATWSAFNTGLPETCINCMALSPGNFVYAGTNGGASYRWTLGTGVGEEESSPLPTTGLSIWPNPTYGSVSVSFDLAQAGEVSVLVYDMQGRIVAAPASGYYDAGLHEISWDGAGAPAGVYIVRMTSGQEVSTGRIVLVR